MKIVTLFLVLMTTQQLCGMEMSVQLANHAKLSTLPQSDDFYEAKCVAENQHYPKDAPLKNRVLKAQPICTNSFELDVVSAQALAPLKATRAIRIATTQAAQQKPAALKSKKAQQKDKQEIQAPAQAALMRLIAPQKLLDQAQIKHADEKAQKEIRAKHAEDDKSKPLASRCYAAKDKAFGSKALDLHVPPQSVLVWGDADAILDNSDGIMLADSAHDWRKIGAESPIARKDILFARSAMDRRTVVPEDAPENRYIFDSERNLEARVSLDDLDDLNQANEKELADIAGSHDGGAAACPGEWDIDSIDGDMFDDLKPREMLPTSYASDEEDLFADLSNFEIIDSLVLLDPTKKSKASKVKLPYASDAHMLDFCHANKNSFVAIVWPNAQGFNQDIIERFNEHGTVYSQKNVALSNDKIYELVWMAHRDVIAHHERTLDVLQMKNYMAKHMKPYLPSTQRAQNHARVFVVTFKDLQTQRACKAQIRALFQMSYSSIHINDTHAETIELAQYFFGADQELAT